MPVCIFWSFLDQKSSKFYLLSRAKRSDSIFSTNFFQWYTWSAQTLVILFLQLGGPARGGGRRKILFLGHSPWDYFLLGSEYLSLIALNPGRDSVYGRRSNIVWVQNWKLWCIMVTNSAVRQLKKLSEPLHWVPMTPWTWPQPCLVKRERESE